MRRPTTITLRCRVATCLAVYAGTQAARAEVEAAARAAGWVLRREQFQRRSYCPAHAEKPR